MRAIARRSALLLAAATAAALAWCPAASAQAGGDSPVGELAGNWSWTVWLLIPLALVTALVLGPAGDPPGRPRREGGVARSLGRRSTKESL